MATFVNAILSPAPVLLACHAMATRFEIALHGSNPSALRAAGEEAIAEIERIENLLSLFRPASEIAHLNARAAFESVRVSPEVFALLERARNLHLETDGAFDITLAPLLRCWGLLGGPGRVPTSSELTEARSVVGMGLVQLDRQSLSVRFDCQGVMLDPGAIGKGYAIERAAMVLREAGISSALLHGGTSSLYAIGHPPDAKSWTIAIQDPREGTRADSAASDFFPPLSSYSLKDEALSVSAIRGKFFCADGQTFGHVLDPRTGRPASGTALAAVVLPSATETDALSTALLVRGSEGHDAIFRLRPGTRTLLVRESGLEFVVETMGSAGH